MEWYRLRIIGLKDSIIAKLMLHFEKYNDIFLLDKELLKLYFKFDDETISLIYQSKKTNLEKELTFFKEKNINIISLKDKNYPINLKNISHPPLFLYYKGDISIANEKTIGIVGTRRPTTYGKRVCEKITTDLVKSQVTIVSGLALGIDAISHKTTLENNGKTIAVVGSGLDIIYPRENKRYWEEIGEKGLLISEFPLGTEPLSYNFPMRNRIIVGLSKGIVVVESKEKGGSLITASLALEEGRDVFAIPGDIYSPVSTGTNNLIKNSEAKLITSSEDILKEFNWPIKESNKINLNLSEDELKIYNILEKEKSLDELIIITGIKAKILLAILMEMEINGYILSISGGKYIRKIK
ncbi:DNA-processing protein DprA [Fusobacterium perfoetens]|uniref:DNA-processing protein DprA n=1 Tax=Fusobacterium perfoetens TaxID=852 RepID=UPI00055C6A10|nr:DNA-processing protein DprA [Fusobacterium perfoetens]MCI6152585.1 DNA-processing protein DprA [Fusobacterium perfoetens]MDY3237592.1 DNA-processing protein DprA [Fusobacterium perfoetens]